MKKKTTGNVQSVSLSSIHRYHNLPLPVHPLISIIGAANQKVIIPGEPELEAEQDRMQNGIPLVDAVANDLNELAVRFGVKAL